MTRNDFEKLAQERNNFGAGNKKYCLILLNQHYPTLLQILTLKFNPTNNPTKILL